MCDTNAVQRTAGLYVRISRDRAGAGLGVQRQEEDCREAAERLGWAVTDVYVDNDLSAYSGKPRPAYRRLLEDLRNGRITAVVAWHTDRLHRSPVELEEFVGVIEHSGALVQTVKAGPLDLSNPSGLLVARLLGNVARYEVDHAVERMRRAKEQAAAAGRWLGGPVPFGWHRDGDSWVLVEAEAAAIRAGCEDVLAGGSLAGVARTWNDAGLRTRRTGRQWDAVAVRRVLDRPRNAGLLEHRGDVVGAGNWPAIVDEATWRAVSALLSDPSRRTSPPPGRRNLGGSLFRCGVCGAPLKSGASGRRSTYSCRPSQHLSRAVGPVDDYVRALVVERLRRADGPALAPPKTPDGVDPGALRFEAQGLRGRLDDLARLFAAGDIDARQLAQATEAVRQRLDGVEQRLSSATAGRPVAAIASAPDPGQAFLDADLVAQRRVIDLLMTVTLQRGARGRPPGWTPGAPYFDSADVLIEWHKGAVT